MRVLAVFGTRPEAIKMAPVLRVLQGQRDWCDLRVCVTAQHRHLLDPLLALFGIVPHHDLDIMRENQSLTDLTSRLFSALGSVVESERPDWVLVQGDTTSAFVAGMVGFYHQAHVGHIEAGLRTPTKHSPFPEEMSRRLLGRIADLHFAPTEGAMRQLVAEGVPSQTVALTGNTAIDALRWTASQLAHDGPAVERRSPDRRLVLVTTHRRESFGEPLERVCRAIRHLADLYGDRVEFLLPVHPNPNVRSSVERLLSDRPNVRLVPPMSYPDLVAALVRAHFVLTDSGGIQEEAPSLGKPVLVLRESTERPEGVAAGVAKLVGTDPDAIVLESRRLLDDDTAYRNMARVVDVYGDGHAAERIAALLRDWAHGTATLMTAAEPLPAT